MKKSSTSLFIILSAAILCSPSKLFAQEELQQTSNYAGLTTAIDFANASVTAGLEYERIVYRKNNFEVGIRGNWYKPYRSGNIDISISGGYISGYGGSYIISLYQGMGTAYLYTSQRKQNRGFFFAFGAGITYSHAEHEDRSASNHPTYNDLLKGVELGMGLNSSLAGNNTLRFCLTGCLFNPQTTPEYGKKGSPLQLLTAKLSVGF